MLEIHFAVEGDITAYTADLDAMARDAIGEYYAGLSIGDGVVRLHLKDGYGKPIPVHDIEGNVIYFTVEPDDNIEAAVNAINEFYIGLGE